MVKSCPRFRLRSAPPDWEAISRVDVDLVMERGDAPRTLSGLIDTLAFSKITPSELRRAGFDATSSLVRLLQISAEYLLHVQEALTAELVEVRGKLKEEKEERRRVGAQLTICELKKDSLERTNDQLGDLVNHRSGRPTWLDEEETMRRSKFDGRTLGNNSLLEDRWRTESIVVADAAPAVLAAFDSVGGRVSDTVPCSALAVALTRSAAARSAIFGNCSSYGPSVDEAVVTTILESYGAGAVHRDMLGPYVDGLRRAADCAKVILTEFGGGQQRFASANDEDQGCCLEVQVCVVGARGLPQVAEAGCVGNLARMGRTLATTRAVIGRRDVVWPPNDDGDDWSDQTRAGSAVFGLDAVSAGAPGVDVEVLGGAVQIGVAHAKVANLMYDGILRLKLRTDDDVEKGRSLFLTRKENGTVELRCRLAARVRFDNLTVKIRAPQDSFPSQDCYTLRAKWRDVAGRGVAWRTSATVLRGTQKAAYVIMVADAPLPLGLPMLRDSAVLDLEVWRETHFVATCEIVAARVRKAMLAAHPDETGRFARPLRFAGDNVVVESMVSCSTLLGPLQAELERREAEPSTTFSKPVVEVLLVSATALTRPFADVITCEARQGDRVALSLDVRPESRVASFHQDPTRTFVVDAEQPVSVTLTRRSDGATIARGVLPTAAFRGRGDLVEIFLDGPEPARVLARLRPLKRVELRVWQAHLPWPSPANNNNNNNNNNGSKNNNYNYNNNNKEPRFALRCIYGGVEVATTRYTADAAWHELHELLLDDGDNPSSSSAEEEKEDPKKNKADPNKAKKCLRLDLLCNQGHGPRIVGQAFVSREDLVRPKRRATRPLVDEASKKVIGELSMAIVASPEKNINMNSNINNTNNADQRGPGGPSSSHDGCGVADVSLEKLVIEEGGEIFGDAAPTFSLTVDGRVAASFQAAKASPSTFTFDKGAIAKTAVAVNGPALVVRCSNATVHAGAYLATAEVLRGAPTTSSQPRELRLELRTADGKVCALKTDLRVATRAQVTLCALQLNDAIRQCKAELYVDGALVGMTKSSPNKSWFERFDLAIPSASPTKGVVQVIVESDKGRYVARVAASAEELLSSKAGLTRFHLFKAEDPTSSPCGSVEVHVALTDFDAPLRRETGCATAAVMDALYALDSSAAQADDLPPHIADALALLRTTH